MVHSAIEGKPKLGNGWKSIGQAHRQEAQPSRMPSASRDGGVEATEFAAASPPAGMGGGEEDRFAPC